MTTAGHDFSPSMTVQNSICLNFGKRTSEFGFVCGMDFAYLHKLPRLGSPKKRFQQLLFFLIGQIPSVSLVMVFGNGSDSFVTIASYDIADICRVIPADLSYFCQGLSFCSQFQRPQSSFNIFILVFSSRFADFCFLFFCDFICLRHHLSLSVIDAFIIIHS